MSIEIRPRYVLYGHPAPLALINLLLVTLLFSGGAGGAVADDYYGPGDPPGGASAYDYYGPGGPVGVASPQTFNVSWVEEWTEGGGEAETSPNGDYMVICSAGEYTLFDSNGQVWSESVTDLDGDDVDIGVSDLGVSFLLDGEDNDLSVFLRDGTELVYGVQGSNDTEVLASILSTDGEYLLLVEGEEEIYLTLLEIDSALSVSWRERVRHGQGPLSTEIYPSSRLFGCNLRGQSEGMLFLFDMHGNNYYNHTYSLPTKLSGGFTSRGDFVFLENGTLHCISANGTSLYQLAVPGNDPFAMELRVLENWILIKDGANLLFYDSDGNFSHNLQTSGYQNLMIREGYIITTSFNASPMIEWRDFQGRNFLNMDMGQVFSEHIDGQVVHFELKALSSYANEMLLFLRCTNEKRYSAMVSVGSYASIAHNGEEADGIVYLNSSCEIWIEWFSLPPYWPEWRVDSGDWNRLDLSAAALVNYSGQGLIEVKSPPGIIEMELFIDMERPYAAVGTEDGTIYWLVEDNVSEIKWCKISLDGEVISDRPEGQVATNYSTHILKIEARDSLNNTFTEQYELEVLPPPIRIDPVYTRGYVMDNGTVAVGPDTLIDFNLTFEAEAMEEEEAVISYSFDTSSWLVYNGEGVPLSKPMGNDSVFYYSVKHRNSSYPANLSSVTLYRDNSPPEIGLSYSEGMVRWNVTDNVKVEKVELFIDDRLVGVFPAGGSRPVSGSHQVRIEALDVVGNKGKGTLRVGENGGSDVTMAVAATASVFSLGTASYLTYLAKKDLYSLLLPFLGLAYSKKEDKPLDHFLRGQMYEYLQNNPGLSYTQIRDHFKMNNGSALYHLHVLEKQGHINSKKEGRHRRFYPSDRRYDLPPLLSDLQQDMMNAIEEQPGITQKGLSKLLGIKRQNVYYNTNVLEDNGLIRTEREGKNIRYYPVDENN